MRSRIEFQIPPRRKRKKKISTQIQYTDTQSDQDLDMDGIGTELSWNWKGEKSIHRIESLRVSHPGEATPSPCKGKTLPNVARWDIQSQRFFLLVPFYASVPSSWKIRYEVTRWWVGTGEMEALHRPIWISRRKTRSKGERQAKRKRVLSFARLIGQASSGSVPMCWA